MLKVHILQSRYVRKGGLGRIFYMRILLILVFTALFSCSAIMAEEVSARHDGLTVSGDGCSVSFSSGRITIRSPYFKAGDIGRFGLLRTIADPYSSAFSLRPEISLHQRYSRQSGFAAGMDGFIAGASLSGRPLVFIQSGWKDYIEGALLFAFPGESGEHGYLADAAAPVDIPVLYASVRGGWRFFDIAGILSFSPDEGIELFGAAGLYWEKYSIYLMAGDTMPLYNERSARSWGIRVSIGETGFRSDIAFQFGAPPVYSADYLPFRASIRSELDIHGIRIYSSMEYSFSGKGNAHKRDRIIFSYEGFSIGYDTSSGPIASYKHRMFEIGYEDRSIYAEIEMDIGEEGRSIRLRLSSDGTVETALSISL